MTKRTSAKHKLDLRMGENILGRPSSPVNKRSYVPEHHGHLGPLRQMLRQASDDFAHLGRQLARRHEHERTRSPWRS